MAAVMTIVGGDSRLPLVDPIQLFLYKNTASFASYGKGWGTLPIDVDKIGGFTRGNEIHVDLGKIDQKEWANAIKLLAHEYGHVVEGAANKRSRSQWFREGFANWTAARVLHSLGWQDYALALERAKFELINSRNLLTGLRDLDWRWKILMESPNGYTRTYVLAFFAVDRLISRAGLPAVLQYMNTGDFDRSFAFSPMDFNRDLRNFLTSLIPPNETDGISIQKPDWKVGYEWTYAIKHPGASPLTTRKIVREEMFEGKPSYVMRAEEQESILSKPTLARLAITRGGEPTSNRYGYSQDLSWPLFPGKQWKNMSTREDSANRRKQKIKYSMRVVEIGEILVPAGRFLAARVQAYHSRNGRLMREYWYSPTTRWLVRLRDYSEIAFREEELVSFKIR